MSIDDFAPVKLHAKGVDCWKTNPGVGLFHPKVARKNVAVAVSCFQNDIADDAWGKTVESVNNMAGAKI